MKSAHAARRVFAPAFAAVAALLVAAAGSNGCRRSEAAPAVAAATPTPPRSPSPTHIEAEAGRFGLRPEERKAVESFLGRHPELRLPAEGDRRVSPSGDDDVKHLYGVYNPYFVRGDLNDDGLLDFVMAFVRRDSSASTPWFTVAVFPGRESGTFGPEVFLERDITLAAGDLSIDRDAVVITPDLDEDATRRYRWDPSRRSYVFVRDDDTEAEPPDLSRT